MEDVNKLVERLRQARANGYLPYACRSLIEEAASTLTTLSERVREVEGERDEARLAWQRVSDKAANATVDSRSEVEGLRKALEIASYACSQVPRFATRRAFANYTVIPDSVIEMARSAHQEASAALHPTNASGAVSALSSGGGGEKGSSCAISGGSRAQEPVKSESPCKSEGGPA